MTCVFWKEGASKHHWGLWSPEGCRTEQPSPSQVLCRCNHLSYFAVLMVRVLPAGLRVVGVAEGPAPRTQKQAQGWKSSSDELGRWGWNAVGLRS